MEDPLASARMEDLLSRIVNLLAKIVESLVKIEASLVRVEDSLNKAGNLPSIETQAAPKTSTERMRALRARKKQAAQATSPCSSSL